MKGRGKVTRFHIWRTSIWWQLCQFSCDTFLQVLLMQVPWLAFTLGGRVPRGFRQTWGIWYKTKISEITKKYNRCVFFFSRGCKVVLCFDPLWVFAAKVEKKKSVPELVLNLWMILTIDVADDTDNLLMQSASNRLEGKKSVFSLLISPVPFSVPFHL